MNECFHKIECHKLTFFTFFDTPDRIFSACNTADPWESLWDKTLNACLEDRDNDELEAEGLAEFIISEACMLACEGSAENHRVRMDLGVQGFFEALDRVDARRAITIVSMLRGRLSRRAKDKCPYELVKEAIEGHRSLCMYNRRQEMKPGYTLEEFYAEFPSMRPSWWPRGARNDTKKGEGVLVAPSRPVTANVQSFKPRSFAAWMDGRKQVEQREGGSTKKRGGGVGRASSSRQSAPQRRAPRRRRGLTLLASYPETGSTKSIAAENG
eukprot:jgi/Mesvir1/21641/Mv04063-RA.1